LSPSSKVWPRPHGPQDAKKLEGYKDHWRVRIGDWRVDMNMLAGSNAATVTGVLTDVLARGDGP